MEDQRTGLILRALRRRRRLRQSDLAQLADVSQSMISRIEVGRLMGIPLDTLRRVFAALDAQLVVTPAWRGGQLERLLDRRHAALVEESVNLLDRLGWSTAVEATFSRFGERGSIDVLAVNAARRAALVVEVKSELVAIEGTIRPLDVKSRLAPLVCVERFGWRPELQGRLLVLPETSTARRQVERHAATLATAFPARGVAVRRWLRGPSGPLSGLVFLSSTQAASHIQDLVTPRRVRPRRGRPRELEPSVGDRKPSVGERNRSVVERKRIVVEPSDTRLAASISLRRPEKLG